MTDEPAPVVDDARAWLSVIEFVRTLRARSVTPSRIDQPAHVACPACNHEVNARRVVVLSCACGRLRVEIDFTSNEIHKESIKERTRRHATATSDESESRMWGRDGR